MGQLFLPNGVQPHEDRMDVLPHMNLYVSMRHELLHHFAPPWSANLFFPKTDSIYKKYSVRTLSPVPPSCVLFLSLLSHSHHSLSPRFSTLPPSSMDMSLDPVWSFSTWAFTVCLFVCSSSPSLGPWWANACDLVVFRDIKTFALLAEVNN